MVAPPFPLWAWLVFGGLVLALLFLDLFVLHRKAREVPFKEAIWLSVFWIVVSLAFGGSSGIWVARRGSKRTLPPTCWRRASRWTTSSCLEGLVDRFVYLHYGLAAILVFVGAKFMAQGFGVGVPILASLLVIVTAITVTIVASLIATRGGKHGEGGTGLGPSTHETDGRKRG